MKKYIKIFSQYTLIFIVVVSILLGALVATAKIPKSQIEENIVESLPFFKGHCGIEKR